MELGTWGEWIGGLGQIAIGGAVIWQAERSHRLAVRITNIERSRYVREDMDRQKTMAEEALKESPPDKMDATAADLISRGFLSGIVKIAYFRIKRARYEGYNEANLKKDFAMVDAIADGLKAIDKS